jgi:hypothetical protein
VTRRNTVVTPSNPGLRWSGGEFWGWHASHTRTGQSSFHGLRSRAPEYRRGAELTSVNLRGISLSSSNQRPTRHERPGATELLALAGRRCDRARLAAAARSRSDAAAGCRASALAWLGHSPGGVSARLPRVLDSHGSGSLGQLARDERTPPQGGRRMDPGGAGP